jgi:hypothetical protein
VLSGAPCASRCCMHTMLSCSADSAMASLHLQQATPCNGCKGGGKSASFTCCHMAPDQLPFKNCCRPATCKLDVQGSVLLLYTMHASVHASPTNNNNQSYPLIMLGPSDSNTHARHLPVAVTLLCSSSALLWLQRLLPVVTVMLHPS